MVRIRHILDPDLKRQVCEVLADWRGFPGPAGVPEWFELDDHDYTDVLQEIKRRESGLHEGEEFPAEPRD